MPKYHPEVEQATLQWLRLHLGKATASSFHKIMTPEFKPRTGEMFKRYVAEKVAESWRGEPLPQFTSWQTDQGLMREEEAIPYLELIYDCKVEPMGFVEADDGRCGCSPDGLIGEDEGVEMKCPESVAHVMYLMDGGIPKDYVTQVYGSLYVTQRKRWKFLSYRRKFPALVVTVERDEEIMEKIGVALSAFYKAFDEGMETLKTRANA